MTRARSRDFVAVVATFVVSSWWCVVSCGRARDASLPAGVTHHEWASDAGADDGSSHDGASARAADALPTLADVAARAPVVAPGMREVAKLEQSADRNRAEVVRATSRDACVRLAFVASAPVAARLEDGAGTALAEIAASESGTLGARGPVCVRRGEVVRVSFDGPLDVRARVRWVAWSSP